MNANTSIRLVKGYHEVTPVPQLAIDEHLKHRFAVVLDVWGNLDDAGFDTLLELKPRLFLEVLREISHTISHDTLRIEIEGGLEFQSLDALSEHLLAIPAGDRGAPLRIHFRRKGKLVCLEETEFWSRCGGHWPYSDSDTLCFYTGEDMSEIFMSACSTVCQRVSVPVGEVIQASVHPVHIPWWKRLYWKVK